MKTLVLFPSLLLASVFSAFTFSGCATPGVVGVVSTYKNEVVIIEEPIGVVIVEPIYLNGYWVYGGHHYRHRPEIRYVPHPRGIIRHHPRPPAMHRREGPPAMHRQRPPVIHRRSALDLDAVLNYVGIPAEPTPHNALTGALSHAEVISRLLYGRKLLPEFSQFEIPKR